MADKKVIFIAFSMEDVKSRDLLKGQSLNTNSPFEYVDMSVKEPYATEWKERVRTRIKRSDGVRRDCSCGHYYLGEPIDGPE